MLSEIFDDPSELDDTKFRFSDEQIRLLHEKEKGLSIGDDEVFEKRKSWERDDITIHETIYESPLLGDPATIETANMEK